jgi:hypothetical protein
MKYEARVRRVCLAVPFWPRQTKMLPPSRKSALPASAPLGAASWAAVTARRVRGPRTGVKRHRDLRRFMRRSSMAVHLFRTSLDVPGAVGSPSSTNNHTQSPPTARVLCPLPVVSSANRMSPRPNDLIVPSDETSTSNRALKGTTYRRHGALCQSLGRAGFAEILPITVAEAFSRLALPT